MIKRFYLLFFLLFFAAFGKLMSNNISVSNISLVGQDTSAGTNNALNYTFVKFDLKWENSWRTNVDPGNWDAAWIFVKYRVFGEEWKHAYLNDSGHFIPVGTSIETGLLNPKVFFNINTNPGMGAFVYRSSDGNGTFEPSGIQLRWNYGSNGVNDNALLEIKVFAVEMVYIVEGSFYLGDGFSSCTFYASPNISSPYQVTNDSVQINIGTATGDLYYNDFSSGAGDQLGPIPAAFPKGFNAFYCMKYEITQMQYVDFLNLLNVNHQQRRTETPTTSLPFSGALSLINEEANGIDIMTSSVGNTPAVYACNLYTDGLFNQEKDGQAYPCNNISWSDITAYLDWSGLRPMTELEYEKVCRGPLYPVQGEYAWGSTFVVSPLSLNDIFTWYETSNPGNSNCSVNIGDPIRVGEFAKSNSNREQSGASYYGVMDMSGNLFESCVSAGNPQGRNFTGLHGNGSLNSLGDADVSFWYGSSSTISSNGFGKRGGYYCGNPDKCTMSYREAATFGISYRSAFNGGRGVRSAP